MLRNQHILIVGGEGGGGGGGGGSSRLDIPSQHITFIFLNLHMVYTMDFEASKIPFCHMV